MSERDLTIPKRDEIAEWDGASVTHEVGVGPSAQGGRGGIVGWMGARLDAVLARLIDGFARRAVPSGSEPVALARTGGPFARWISFPRGVRVATAATSSAAAGLAAWGVLAMADNELGVAAAAASAAAALSAAWGQIGVRMANRLHRLIATHRHFRVSELRAIPDRRAVAVRGVVIARRTAASALDERSTVWSLVRFRKGTWFATDFFHETAFDFLLDDGTDEPIWIEVTGGMLLDAFPP